MVRQEMSQWQTLSDLIQNKSCRTQFNGQTRLSLARSDATLGEREALVDHIHHFTPLFSFHYYLYYYYLSEPMSQSRVLRSRRQRHNTHPCIIRMKHPCDWLCNIMLSSGPGDCKYVHHCLKSLTSIIVLNVCHVCSINLASLGRVAPSVTRCVFGECFWNVG